MAPVAEAAPEVASTTPESEAPPADAIPAAERSTPNRLILGGGGLSGGGVRVNRPGLDAPPEDVATPPEAADEELPALRRHAAAFESPDEERPSLAVVLIDDGTDLGPEAVEALPVPVSIAIDPALNGARERMSAYRERGIEVLALADLPEGAQATDAVSLLGATLDILPETVALLDLGNGGFDGRGALAEAAMGLAKREGRGVVLGSDGLRSGLDLATSVGVPATDVLRDLGTAGQDEASIRRSLDDATRRTGQAGDGVVLGHLTPETLAALTDWSQDRRAEGVTVAPVSAVLLMTGEADL